MTERQGAPAQPEVVVVGAGFAGLYAAVTLQRAGVDTVVLEARSRVGGRVRSRAVANGAAVELGAAWVTEDQSVLLGIAEALGLKVEPMRSEGAMVLLADGHAVALSDGDVTALDEDARAAIDDLDRLAAGVDPAAPWMTADAVRHDSRSLGDWLLDRLPADKSRIPLELAAEGYFARSPMEVTLLHALFYARANGGFDHLLGDSGDPCSQYVVSGGVQAIAGGLADELGPAVRLSQPVTEVHQDDHAATVATGSQRVSAQRAIIALPPTLAQRLRYDPLMPWQRDQLTQRWSIGSGWKCHLVYESAFWREDGLNGRVLDLDGGSSSWDTSPASGRPGIMTCQWPIARSDELDSAGEQARREVFVEMLQRAFGPHAARATGYHERMWWREPFSRGDVAVPSAGTWSAFGSALREPVGRIHWAGTETSVEFPGQMEGALRSGERAAREVLALL